ncbi:OmpA family protein [Thiotrichales bacterium 19S11-10]|nr:OmpA family protein [Thiotrichales bacterium 19S11-10]MCF6807222.1 OmpA family protein [Thiotrichales bacterium 19S9-11]MCF6811191.1 OmpA family protein [Thiotrichales bacterium 19S9-12]
MNTIIKLLSTALAFAVLVGCAYNKGGPAGPGDSMVAYAKNKTSSGSNLEKMVSNSNSYTWQQRSELMKKLAQMPTAVYFSSSSTSLKKSTKQALNEVAELLEKYPMQTLRIEGHADPKGNAKNNLKIGKARADSVKKYLVQQGVNKNQICTISLGESNPAVSPDDVDGDVKRAYDLDRRAVLDFGQSC